MREICGPLLWFFLNASVSFYKYFVYILFCASTKIKLFLELNATLTSTPLKSLELYSAQACIQFNNINFTPVFAF